MVHAKKFYIIIGSSLLVAACGPAPNHQGATQQIVEDQCAPADAQRSASAIPYAEIGIPINGAGPAETPVAMARTWIAPGAKRGIIFVTGVDGGFEEPVDDIYTRMAQRFYRECVSSIFVQYRYPGSINESVQDALSAADYLRKNGVQKMAVAGWSFGGAVTIHTTTLVPEVVTAIGFAPQGLETEPVRHLEPRHSLLVIHSREDENVPFDSSELLFSEIPEAVESRFHVIDFGDHHLTGKGPEIDPLVESWLDQRLLKATL